MEERGINSPASFRIVQDDNLKDIVKEAVKAVIQNKKPEPWITIAEAMKILGITSLTTMNKILYSSEVVYSQPSKKVRLVLRSSLYDYINKYRVQ
ncbi:MAG: hypothetical protein R2764_08305 [Bacteroidales bacterium]